MSEAGRHRGFIFGFASPAATWAAAIHRQNKHATKHFHATRHPIIKSFEPGEDWGWCYVDRLMLDFSDVVQQS